MVKVQRLRARRVRVRSLRAQRVKVRRGGVRRVRIRTNYTDASTEFIMRMQVLSLSCGSEY